MSKSKGNVINPDELVGKFGADAVRLYLAFIGPYNEPGNYPWNLDGVEATKRFLDRVYKLSTKVSASSFSITEMKSFDLALGKAAAKVGVDIERFKFNTAISSLMILLRDLEKFESIPQQTFAEFLCLLAPFAPHLTEELWIKEGSVHQSVWPHEGMDIREEKVKVIVQINSKKKGEITTHEGASEDEALTLAMEIGAFMQARASDPQARIIYVPGRILNLVTSN